MIWLTATVGRMSWAAAVAEEAIWNFNFDGSCPSSTTDNVLVVLEDPQTTFWSSSIWGKPCPHSIPPLNMLVMTPYPGIRPVAESAANGVNGVHWPVMTSRQEGFGDCGVIKNQMAALKEMVASAATKSGLANRSLPMAIPAGVALMRFNIHVFHTFLIP
ncbi:hypothetical protein RHGRI_030446 [Rhododendron griersonianum]|uniref:Uncharacterized protein n=1 Tax=Rhododendron griersonianum TaxID=479676 RepID=A0AAV6ITB7_9ERIC|nr:hypothetical protein RHGRI_030446 [Rhododendron griersonianum]